MPSTHFSLYYHFVFSTKNRERLIQPEHLERVHQYIGGVIRNMDGVAHAVGGVEDHVHIFATLRPVHRISDVMMELKGDTSKWIAGEVGVRQFAWQEGYGVFSVSASNFSRVLKYVLNQETRHRRQTYEDEYQTMLRNGMVEFNERYLW